MYDRLETWSVCLRELPQLCLLITDKLTCSLLNSRAECGYDWVVLVVNTVDILEVTSIQAWTKESPRIC